MAFTIRTWRGWLGLEKRPATPASGNDTWSPPAGLDVELLMSAINDMARMLDGIDTGGTYGSFSCMELDSVVRVLALAGHNEEAAFVVLAHAEESEEDGDEHFHITESMPNGRHTEAAWALSRLYVRDMLAVA